MSKASIYTINGGAEIAYQKGTSRAVVKKDGSEFHEVKENGEWRAARGYFHPHFIAKVKALVSA